MKRILLSAFALMLSVLAYSQAIIENPKVGMNTVSYLKLEKIELHDTATVFWFHVKHTPGNQILIPKETYIQPLGATEKLYIISAEGIKLNEQYIMPSSGEVNYKLYFPRIDASVSKVDFGEGNEGGSWFIYDIQLKPELFKSLLPEKITGNWFRSDNAQWEISLFDSVAVYKSQVWKYKKYAEKDGLGKISLKSGAKTLEIYARLINDSTYMFGENPAKLIMHTNKPNESAIPTDQQYFKLPLFKMDTVTYIGFFKDFSPRFPQRTGMVYVNDVLTGEQASHVVKIADDGTFRLKFSYSNPQLVLVRHQFYNETVLLEPGKTTFQLFNLGGKTNPVLFMGDCARINTDLIKLSSINRFDNKNDLEEKILDFSPEQYKSWCQDLKQKDLEELADYAQTHSVSAKAIQVKRLAIDYRYSNNLFEYDVRSEAAYRKTNNIPQDHHVIPFEPTEPDTTYYTFLTNDLVNNPLAVMSPDYLYFMQQLRNLNILNGKPKGTFPSDILEALEKTDYQLTLQEKEFADQIREIESLEFKSVQDEFQLTNISEEIFF